ncbi:MAG: YebC/PmpR family DNA-binding transcriptional regulator, partial [Candidatus Eremiobacteraeota bacterium]|nr:YebC/PmpR family DNA-binding transcriptional regulator [Candidatus Eremiobacteraeota bacterium]
IILSAKSGSPDPEANYRLKMAVDKARANNMPADTIKRAIARAGGAGGEKEIEEIRYEGYGPGGIATIVDAATDNRNRTASELRFLFSRNEGTLGESGSVAWMFDQRGLIDVETGGLSEDALTEKALVDGVIDVRHGSEGSEIVTEPTALNAVREALSAAGLRVTGAQLGMVPKQPVHPADGETAKILDFLEGLEEHEDVQRVYSNVELDDAQVEALARA